METCQRPEYCDLALGFMNVTVRLTDSDQIRMPQVRFAIEATLRMDPSPEQIVFDTVLEIASGSYAVDENG